jgi:apolipoprotein N-acyltransferase
MKLFAASTAPRTSGMQASTFSIAVGGSLLMWAAQPPLALAWLAWIAPVPWLMLVRADEMPGRRPYRALWLAGFIYWLAAIQWLRLAHPAVYVGWFVLSAYLAVYLPVFVAIARVAVHRFRVPLWLAAPVAWTGLELARAHLFTGFLMGSLAHTQVRNTILIQVSDLVGEYGVDFLIMAVAAAITSVILPPRKYFAVVPAAVLLASVLVYGNRQLDRTHANVDKAVTPRTVRIALIQGNSLPDWEYVPAKQLEIMEEYVGLSRDALAKAKQTGDGRPPDLVVWPETTFRTGLREVDANLRWPPLATQTPEEYVAAGPRDLASLVELLKTPVLVGTDRLHLIADPTAPVKKPRFQAYNSSTLVDRNGKIVGTYDKSHLVMFGEYIPFAKWFPNLYRLSPITAGTEEGDGPKALCIGGVCYSPNICYETAIPHVIRDQVATLTAENDQPDVMVNITNDAWYWGSSELDMHLACSVFRAIETRTPMVVAANGGISAWIDAEGVIRTESPRQQPDVIIADVELNAANKPTVYVATGDWFAGACVACDVCIAMMFLTIALGKIAWLDRAWIGK